MNLNEALQRYVAVTSVGASAVRGSPAGTADAAREFLAAVSLRQFGTNRERAFRERLDSTTEDLRRALPARRKHWGLARKLINIFLHNAFYNHYLRTHYRLDRAEPFFEVPVDSAVARGLRLKQSKDEKLPTWRGLVSLTAEENEKFQERATVLAQELGIARVHLDAVLWVQQR